MVLYPIAVGLSNETSTGLYFYKLKEHPFVAVTDMSVLNLFIITHFFLLFQVILSYYSIYKSSLLTIFKGTVPSEKIDFKKV